MFHIFWTTTQCIDACFDLSLERVKNIQEAENRTWIFLINRVWIMNTNRFKIAQASEWGTEVKFYTVVLSPWVLGSSGGRSSCFFFFFADNATASSSLTLSSRIVTILLLSESETSSATRL